MSDPAADWEMQELTRLVERHARRAVDRTTRGAGQDRQERQDRRDRRESTTPNDAA